MPNTENPHLEPSDRRTSPPRHICQYIPAFPQGPEPESGPGPSRPRILSPEEATTISAIASQYSPWVQSIMERYAIAPLPDEVINTLTLLGIPKQTTGESFLGHSEMLTDMVADLFTELSKYAPELIAGITRERILKATLTHDVGKTGPPKSKNKNPKAFVHFYNTNFPEKMDKRMSFQEALTQAIKLGSITPAERQDIETTLTNCGFDPRTMTLRNFYNLHSIFTYRILKEAGIDEDIAAMAAGHHLKREVVPDGHMIEDLAQTGRILEPLDELAAMLRSDNPKHTCPVAKLLWLVYRHFAENHSPASEPYCRLILTATRHGILQRILAKYPRQEG